MRTIVPVMVKEKNGIDIRGFVLVGLVMMKWMMGWDERRVPGYFILMVASLGATVRGCDV